MFTGLITSRACVLEVRSQGTDRRLKLAAENQAAFAEIEDGESIAVNGACLTVEAHSGNTFLLYASAETLAKTALRQLTLNSRPNLERALCLGDRLGGHLVTGHVDCVATVLKKARTGLSVCFTISYPKTLARQIVAKGSVALDGISLTINSVGPDYLTVNVIPETFSHTTVADWQEGSLINLETDILGKYVQRSLALEDKGRDKTQGGVDYELLMRNGFL